MKLLIFGHFVIFTNGSVIWFNLIERRILKNRDSCNHIISLGGKKGKW